MQVVNYSPNGLQTPLRSVADTNNIPTSTTTSTNTNSTTTTSSSSANDIMNNAKEFIQDNSTYLLVGVGLIVLLVVLRN